MILRLDRKTGAPSLTLPKRMPSQHAIHQFLTQSSAWLQEVIADQQKIADQAKLEAGNFIQIYGEAYRIAHSPTARSGVVLDQDQKCLIVSGDAAYLEARIKRFLKKEAARVLVSKTKQVAAKLNKTPNRIVIKDQSTRFGSCSSKLNINLNWRLILCPEFVQDYVVAHEVAHLEQMNHTPAFWKVVAKLDPEYGKAERWLKTNAQLLFAY